MMGSYVTDDFVVSKGNTYYFDGDGKKASGWQDINGSRYYFDKDGMMKTGWLDSDDGSITWVRTARLISAGRISTARLTILI